MPESSSKISKEEFGTRYRAYYATYCVTIEDWEVSWEYERYLKDRSWFGVWIGELKYEATKD